MKIIPAIIFIIAGLGSTRKYFFSLGIIPRFQDFQTSIIIDLDKIYERLSLAFMRMYLKLIFKKLNNFCYLLFYVVKIGPLQKLNTAMV